MAGYFRYSIWDPILLISQILTIQCIYYTCLGFWFACIDSMLGTQQSLNQIFRFQDLRIKETGGRVIVAAFVLNSLTCAFGLWYVVGRTKQCLDFTITAHFLHLIGCWCFNGLFPSTTAWWLLVLVCITLMCVCGEFLCMRTEMKSIPLSLGSKVDL